MVDGIVTTALEVVFGLFIVNMACRAFLYIDLLECAARLIAKLSGKSYDEDDED